VSRENAIRSRLRTPRAAAIAGILFSILLITSQLLVWISIPANVGEAASEVVSQSKRISLALNLLPFAGIAFLWFIGVVRDRLGALEDRFFATVFLRKRITVHSDDFYFGRACRWTYSNLEQLARNPSTDRSLCSESRPNLPEYERLRNQDGRSVYVFDFDNLAPNRNCSKVDSLVWVCLGDCAPAEYGTCCLDSARVSSVGIPGEHWYSARTALRSLQLWRIKAPTITKIAATSDQLRQSRATL
jgi:hypothetical protein